jgi:chaperone protein EcpD
MFRNIFCISILMMLSTNVSASIVMDITRVIYNAGMREVTIPITNRSNKPVLVQSWLDTGNKASSPHLMTRPSSSFLLLLVSMLKVTRLCAFMWLTAPALPRDRESLFWLNVLDVPMKLPAGEG